MSWGGWAPYVSVAERKAQAERKVKALKKKGQCIHPVVIEGRTISKTFWGKSWCTNLESYSDYENRLPRGRTYVRNGSVIDLKIGVGEINAMVSGSSIYTVTIFITAIDPGKWKSLVEGCSGKISSLIELLQGKFSKGVMEIIAAPEKGLFPHPNDMKFNCDCYDYASMCKHVAAALYGVGNRLDNSPETLFLLRHANHMDLIGKAEALSFTKNHDAQSSQLTGDLSALFGIEMEDTTVPSASDKKAKFQTKVTSKKKVSTPKVIAKMAVKPSQKKLSSPKKKLVSTAKKKLSTQPKS
ncbi:SWIM zinc finger family protein [Candidatus Bealeia paramacronuclearis]|uniref:SWIM zinc finger family protein n=1 Tax=Candidatus Bealeia paramacronuclearis TaxID=1921001 RepID=A0ABZ2C2R6_9PROT|nr:SWIM zinc finger family protein [Candidatus Bealeia paramacronuclearis]